MAQNRLGGSGIGLPYPQSLYPVNLLGSPVTAATNRVDLAAGDALPVPGGDWVIQLGKYVFLQWLDPVTGIWQSYASSPGTTQYVHSDGQNIRVANLTGCPIGAVVTGAGSGYVQASTTVNASAGGSTWQPIVGGALNTSVSIVSAGSGYTIPPEVFIPAPQSPGVAATAYAVISSGTVSSISVLNQGAGYTTAPSLTILGAPNDPNYGSIVNATAVATLTGSGSITAVLCTNNGAPQAAAPTLTVAGVGMGATVSATMCWTATGASITSAGLGYATATEITSIGGRPTATPVFANPAIETSLMSPRPAMMLAAVASTSITSVSQIYDGGLFSGTPTTLLLTSGIVSTVASVTLTLGSTPDGVFIQPL